MAILAAENVTKRYGGTQALRGVDFAVHAGAVNVLIGENGAGKSTLMRILAGIEQPTSGRLVMDGEEVAFGSVRQAAAHGIGMIHQELNLCPNLTIAENVFLAPAKAGRRALLDKAAEREATRALLARLDQDLDPATPVSALRVGQQQVVEIAKALAEEARVLIMDEPTSALSAAEVDALFRVIDELRRGGVAIVYISHRLEELLRIGDRITVLRDGALVASADVADVSLAWIVERMLGDAGKIARTRPPAVQGREVLAVRDVRLAAGDGAVALDRIAASFHAGEITAIYGLLGSGRTELFEIVCGARAPTGGSVVLDGSPLDGLTIAERARRGLLLVPEDRQREGVFANLSVGENIGLSVLPRFLRNGLISRARENSAVASMIARLGIKARSPALAIGALSGGNQQKAVIGRALMPGPAALLLDEPSRGIDVGARAEVFETMQRLASDGLAVIFSTSDLLEPLAIADRILVMANGRITADMRADQTDEEALVRAANAVPARQPETMH